MIDPAGSQMLGSIGTWGWSGAASTWFRIDPHEVINMILMTQYMSPVGLPVDRDFSNMVYQSIKNNFTPPPAPPLRGAGSLPKKDMSAAVRPHSCLFSYNSFPALEGEI